MTPSTKVKTILGELGLNYSQFFLGGSAALALRDLRDIGDLDIGVTTRYWFDLVAQRRSAPSLDPPGYTEPVWNVYTPDPTNDWECCDPPYLYREINGTEVNVFHAWRRRGAEETPFNDFNLVFREGVELVGGIPVIKLPILLRQKTDAVVNGIWGNGSIRPKDVQDIRIITDYLVGELS